MAVNDGAQRLFASGLCVALALCTASKARADRGATWLELRPGIASRQATGVGFGPYLGAEAAVGLSEQLFLTADASLSRHAIASGSGGGALLVEQLGGGFSYLIDQAPVLPFIDVGLVAARRTTPRAHALDPWPYLGLTVALSRSPLLVGVAARYGIQLNNGATSYGYAQLGLVIGLEHGLTTP